MKILKKIAGYCLLLIDVLFILVLLKSILDLLKSVLMEVATHHINVAYNLGSLIALILFGILIVYIWKLGLKLIRQKTIIPKETIEDIGSN